MSVEKNVESTMQVDHFKYLSSTTILLDEFAYLGTII